MLKNFSSFVSSALSGQVRHYAAAARTKGTPLMKKNKKMRPKKVLYNTKRLGPNFMFKPTPASFKGPLFERQSPVKPVKLQTLDPNTITEHSIGQPASFNNAQMLKAYGVPRTAVLEFRLLEKPCSVVREVTLKSFETLNDCKDKSSIDSRIIMTGPSGCGKSFTLLQTVDYALSSGWIVLYVPRTISMLNSSTNYRYDLRTQLYQQPDYSQNILKRLLDVNAEQLKGLKVIRRIRMMRLKNAFTTGTSLTHLIQAGSKDASIAPDVLSVVMEQLAAQTEYPVLLAIDDFQALYCMSEYRGPDFNFIKSMHLSVPRILLDYAGGLKKIRRGAVFGAVSTTNTRYPIPVQLQEALKLPLSHTAGAYDYRSSSLEPYTHGLRKFEHPAQLSIPEASGLFELWAQTSSLHTKPTDDLFLSKYTESSGNPRNFIWNGLLSNLET
ncbi:hypothetical protein M422DRAFT_23875 [Sphaerobolus stellatus SS14]|nr:hypothetical protein M422DRAFT_23875 [Sphaerobolus stellatus SS14]